MQTVNIPAKWVIPFAQGDSGKVEVPATTTDPTRASLLLGFPPLTMQPPEAGGVPPQGEDFNGAMNQVARITWWRMAGGQFPYDATFASDSNINGYPKGAVVASIDLRGAWISTAENNAVDPDNVGTGWVPGFAYGVTALTGQTGGTNTLTPAQAMKRTLSVAGTLTSNLTIVVPNWQYNWTVANATTGAFTVTVKTVAGSGVLIPQNSAPTPITGDGTNVTQLAQNIAQATQGMQAARLDQTVGRLINVRVFSSPGSYTYTPTAGTNSVIVDVIGGGGGANSVTAPASDTASVSSGGGGGAYVRARMVSNFTGAAITVGVGGNGGGVNGGLATAGGSSKFTNGVFAGGGASGSNINNPVVTVAVARGAVGGVAASSVTTGLTALVLANGATGGDGFVLTNGTFGGNGGSAGNGSLGGRGIGSGVAGGAAAGHGGGGGGTAAYFGATPANGGSGASGVVIVYEYA